MKNFKITKLLIKCFALILAVEGVVIQYNDEDLYQLELQQNDQLLEKCVDESKIESEKFVKYFYNKSEKYKELQKYKHALACYFAGLGYLNQNGELLYDKIKQGITLPIEDQVMRKGMDGLVDFCFTKSNAAFPEDKVYQLTTCLTHMVEAASSF